MERSAVDFNVVLSLGGFALDATMLFGVRIDSQVDQYVEVRD